MTLDDPDPMNAYRTTLDGFDALKYSKSKSVPTELVSAVVILKLNSYPSLTVSTNPVKAETSVGCVLQLMTGSDQGPPLSPFTARTLYSTEPPLRISVG